MVTSIGILQRLKNLEAAVFDGPLVSDTIDDAPDGLPLLSEMVQLVTLELTDAQIKALPTTPIELIPAPGPGKQNVAWLGFTHFDSHGAYTNFDMGISMSVGYKDSSNAMLSTSAPDLLLGSSSDYNLQLTPAFGSGDLDAIVVDTPVQLKFNNGGSGNLTGGNAANVLTVKVYYGVIDVPA